MTSAASAGYVLAALFYGSLFALLLASGQRTRHGAAALLAAGTTAAAAAAALVAPPPLGDPLAPARGGAAALTLALDTGRLLTWTVLPLLLLGERGVGGAGPAARRPPESSDREDEGVAGREDRRWQSSAIDVRPVGRRDAPRRVAARPSVTASLSLVAIAVHAALSVRWPNPEFALVLERQILPLVRLVIVLHALSLVEQVWRAADPGRRRAAALLCLALGATFAFEFVVATDALLFRRVDPALWSAGGYVSAVLAVPIALALGSTPERAMRLHVSRQTVTGSVVMLLAGAYLLLIAATGYLVRLTNVEAGGTLRVVFATLALAGLGATLASGRLRAKLRVFLAKHLFSYKYDDRAEWLRFTGTLAENAATPPAAIVRALTATVESDTGVLWGRRGHEPFALLAQQGATGYDRVDPEELDPLGRFMARTGWIVDLDEYRATPERYGGLRLPADFTDGAAAWLLVPLPHGEDLVGVVLIGRSALVKRIDWEDRDLLKTVGHQAAGQLALHLADTALAQARQFEAFNKASTYVVHDLKNILGQQSLIVANAARHRHNPEFVDDVIETVENSVARMRALLVQLDKRGSSPNLRVPVDLGALLESVVERASARTPAPALEIVAGGPATVAADSERLARVVGHLVQNAQEACGPNGRVTVSLRADAASALVAVEDDGHGMDEGFVASELFRPFRSTKGLTGMGVGAFEAREYARELGGRLDVTSAPGEGSRFELRLPLVSSTRAVADGGTSGADRARSRPDGEDAP